MKQRLAAIRKAVRAAAFAVTSAWQASPSMLLASAAVSVLLAFLPAAQVVAVGWLTASVTDGRASMTALLVLALTVGAGQISGEMAFIVQDRLARHLREAQQNQLMAAIGRLSPQSLATAEVNADMQACRGALYDLSFAAVATLNAVRGLAAALLLCVAVWRIDPVAGGLVTVALLPRLLVDSWEAGLQDRLWSVIGEIERRVGYAQEQLVFQRSATELGTLGSAHHMAGLVAHHQGRLRGIWDSYYRKVFVANGLGALAMAALLGFALHSVVGRGLGAAAVAAGVVAVLAGVNATASAGFSVGQLITVAPKATRFREFLDAAPAADGQVIVPVVESLEARDITVTYPEATAPAVTGASLSARRGEMVALVGVNGAGKTTMVNAILGIVDTDSGQVTIDGVDADTMSPSRRLSHFGLLTQEFGRYELTVRQALMLGTPEDAEQVTDSRLWAALDSARIGDLVREMPDGLDSQLGQQWEGRGLSGGQWQRLALARIHLRNAGVWILDEPTSAIDAEAESEIFEELYRTRADRIAIIVSHRAWTLRRMDRIHVFDGGRVIESGTYPELLARGGRFAEIFAEQAR